MDDNKQVEIGSIQFHIANVLSLTLITGLMTFLLLFVYYFTYEEVDPTQEVVTLLGENAVNYTVIQQNLQKSDIDILSVRARARISEYFVSDEIMQFLVKDKETDETVMKVYSLGSGGFGGTITALVGVDRDKVLVHKVLNANSETAGLGQRVAERTFQRQFINKTKEQLPVDRMDWLPKKIDMISGATFSSTAIVNNIKKAFDLYQVEGGANG